MRADQGGIFEEQSKGLVGSAGKAAVAAAVAAAVPNCDERTTSQQIDLVANKPCHKFRKNSAAAEVKAAAASLQQQQQQKQQQQGAQPLPPPPSLLPLTQPFQVSLWHGWWKGNSCWHTRASRNASGSALSCWKTALTRATTHLSYRSSTQPQALATACAALHGWKQGQA